MMMIFVGKELNREQVIRKNLNMNQIMKVTVDSVLEIFHA
jgi:hypothetical protein